MEYRLGRAGSAVGLMAAGLLGLSACSQAEDPAKVCAATETQDQVKDLLVQAANKVEGAIGVTATDLDATKLKPLVKIDLVTLAGNDATTHKITCNARASLVVPKDLRDHAIPVAGLTDAETMLSGNAVPITFTRQPAANGSGYVFGVDKGEPIGAGLVVAWEAMKDAAKAGANASPPAPAQTSAAVPDLTAFGGGPYKPVNLPGSIEGGVEVCTAQGQCKDTPDGAETEGMVLASDGAYAIVKVGNDMLKTESKFVGLNTKACNIKLDAYLGGLTC
jgi:hypothetical protein